MQGGLIMPYGITKQLEEIACHLFCAKPLTETGELDP